MKHLVTAFNCYTNCYIFRAPRAWCCIRRSPQAGVVACRSLRSGRCLRAAQRDRRTLRRLELSRGAEGRFPPARPWLQNHFTLGQPKPVVRPRGRLAGTRSEVRARSKTRMVSVSVSVVSADSLAKGRCRRDRVPRPPPAGVLAGHARLRRVQGSADASMAGTRATDAARMAIGPICTLHYITIRLIPERCCAVEVRAEVGWRSGDGSRASAAEVVTPQIHRGSAGCLRLRSNRGCRAHRSGGCGHPSRRGRD